MRVVVCGAGVIGLATALLLARDGHEVTVLEQDAAPPPETARHAWSGWGRSGVPQWRQPHNLFPRFQQVLDLELPDVSAALVDAGCGWVDPMSSLPPTIADRHPRPGDERFRFLTGRRPVVEAALSQVAAAEPGVHVARGVDVAGLLLAPLPGASVPVVVGVRGADGTEFRGDVVIDAMGRRSPVASWLAELGAAVAVDSQDRGFVYYTRYFRGDLPARMAPGLTPLGSFSILTIAGDADTWSVTLFGTAHDRVIKQVRHPDRFSALVDALPLHRHWLLGEPITDVLPMGGVLDCHRRYVGADDRPLVAGLLTVGDAWACTNPSAGRGLSVGIVHAQLLRDLLRDVDADDPDLVRAWDERTEQVVGPFFRNQQAADRERIAEMEAHRDGLPAPPGNPERVRLASAAVVDPDAFRGMLELLTCLALPEQVLARPVVRQAMEDAGCDEAPRYPGPTRRELVDLLT